MQSAIDKIIGMFSLREGRFGPHPEETVICGPNDRAIFGYDTYFSRDELIEDFGFTPEEADWFITTVRTHAQ